MAALLLTLTRHKARTQSVISPYGIKIRICFVITQLKCNPKRLRFCLGH